MSDDLPLIRFRRILSEVAYRHWLIEALPDATGHYLQVRFRDGAAEWTGRKWRLSVHMTKSEVVQTALKAVLAAEEHEARERFLFRGRAVFGPHIDVESLWEVCSRVDTRRER